MTFLYLFALSLVAMLAANTLVEWAYKLSSCKKKQQESQK